MSTDPSYGSRPGQTAGAAGDWRAARRQHILDAARTIFLRDGYRGTTMERVAEEAGVSKQTLYNNFGDKEELFEGLLERRREADLVGALARALDAAADFNPEQAVRLAAEALVRSGLDPDFIGIHRIIIELAAEQPDVMMRVRERTFLKNVAAVQAALERGMAAGRIGPIDAEAVAYIIFGVSASIGLFRPSVHDEVSERLTPERMASALGGLLAHGLLAQPV